MQLFPKLEVLKSEVNLQWARGMPVAIVAGQRSGKTTMAIKLVRETCSTEAPTPRIFWAAITLRQAKSTAEEFLEALPVYYQTIDDLASKIRAAQARGRKYLRPTDVVVIDEAFWADGSEDLFFLAAAQATRVLAIGSSGDCTWRCDALLPKYATWDLNPLISRDDLREAFQRNPVAAQRDFGCTPSVPA